jgi:transposase
MSKLFCVHETVNYYLYRRPVKMSKSFDSLAALIRSELNRDIINGDVFLFLNRTRTMIKVLVYERKGFSIFYRRLDEGAFQLLAITDDQISYKMSTEQLLFLLCGVTLETGGYIKAEKYEPLLGSEAQVTHICE